MSYTVDIIDQSQPIIGGVPRSLAEARGDILVATGPGTFVRLPAPEDPAEGTTLVLTFNPTTGLPAWAALEVDTNPPVDPPDGQMTLAEFESLTAGEFASLTAGAFA